MVEIRRARRDEFERVGRLGFVRAPERDVLPERWNDPPFPDVPAEWVGESFLAYLWPSPSSP